MRNTEKTTESDNQSSKQEGNKETSKMSLEDDDEIRQVALSVVEDILTKASEEASSRCEINMGSLPTKHLPVPPNSLQLGTPTIQIDLVGSRTPSPIEESTYQMPIPVRRSKKKKQSESADDIQIEMREEDEDVENQIDSFTKDKQKTDSESIEDTASLREFLVGYINDIITKALPLAEERLLNKVEQMEIEEITTKLTSGPWHLRIREAVTRFLETMCVCGDRREHMS